MKVVLYHSNCQDGFFAAATLFQLFGKDALYIPVGYKPIQDLGPYEALAHLFNPKKEQELFEKGNSVHKLSHVHPDMYKDVELYIVDYSVPVEHFLVYTSLFKSVLMLDHHVTAVKSYMSHFSADESPEGWIVMCPTENSKIVFSDKDSGAKLTHRYFHRNQSVPYYIELVSDRDLWQFKLSETDLFHYGVRLLNEENIQKVLDYASTNFEFILNLGELQKKEIHTRIKSVKRHGVLPINVTIGEHSYKAAIINSNLDIASDLCNSTIKEGYDIAMAYAIQNLDDVSFSVRSAKSVDSSLISLHFGGGGHAQASGFHAPTNVLFGMMSSQELKI